MKLDEMKERVMMASGSIPRREERLMFLSLPAAETEGEFVESIIEMTTETLKFTSGISAEHSKHLDRELSKQRIEDGDAYTLKDIINE